MKTLFAILTMIIGAHVNGAFAQEFKMPTEPFEPGRRSRGKIEREDYLYAMQQSDTLAMSSLNLTKRNNKLPGHSEISVVQTATGQTYTGSKKGIKMWDGYATIYITTDNSHIPANHISALAVDRKDHLWIGTYNSGVVIGIGNDIKPFKIKVIPTRDLAILSITVDTQGLVWVTSRNGGIECFKDEISCSYVPGR